MTSPLRPCPDCVNVNGILMAHTTLDNYWEQLKCPECNVQWHICTSCCKRWTWYDRPKVMHHFRDVIHPTPIFMETNQSSHPSCGISPNEVLIHSEIPTFDSEISNSIHTTGECTSIGTDSTKLVCLHDISKIMSNASKRYFIREMQHAGYGAQGLVGGAFLHAQGLSIMADKAATHFHMLLLSLLKDMSVSQQTILMELFKHIKANPTLCTNTHLPTCILDSM